MSGRERQLVCLVGLRGAGKTSVGRRVAKQLGWPFTDLDEALVELWLAESESPAKVARPRAGEILAQLGEPAFRTLEARALESLFAAGGPRVIATGGGCVETAASRARLSSARTFWLSAEPELLARRIAADPTPRPALLGGDPLAEMAAIAARRAAWYAEVGERTLDAAASIDAVVAELIRCLEG